VVKQLDDMYIARRHGKLRADIAAISARLCSLPVQEEIAMPAAATTPLLCAYLLRNDALLQQEICGTDANGFPFSLRLVGGFEMIDLG
jgi:hypothetical protein